MPLVTPAISMRSSLPFLLAALPAAFFIACGQPNAEGANYLFLEFSYSSQENSKKKVMVMGRQTKGQGLWE